MTKAELIEKIAKDADIPKTTAKAAFDSALDGIKKGSRKGTARSPWLDLGPFEMFIGKPGWGAIPRPVKR
jgi:nucleoid DNA-binding protein